MSVKMTSKYCKHCDKKVLATGEKAKPHPSSAPDIGHSGTLDHPVDHHIGKEQPFAVPLFAVRIEALGLFRRLFLHRPLKVQSLMRIEDVADRHPMAKIMQGVDGRF